MTRLGWDFCSTLMCVVKREWESMKGVAQLACETSQTLIEILLNMFQVDGSGRELIRVGGQESETFKSHQQSPSQQTVKLPDWCSALVILGKSVTSKLFSF